MVECIVSRLGGLAIAAFHVVHSALQVAVHALDQGHLGRVALSSLNCVYLSEKLTTLIIDKVHRIPKGYLVQVPGYF